MGLYIFCLRPTFRWNLFSTFVSLLTPNDRLSVSYEEEDEESDDDHLDETEVAVQRPVRPLSSPSYLISLIMTSISHLFSQVTRMSSGFRETSVKKKYLLP
ncbi:hypothetical protein MJ1HA_2093 [Metallosphaera sedula]|nr:hypothetical protein [Metallosphaera sedula]BBL47978.1 hypothetical protein MJ1HA_2093 [Metallosphaera sedula]